MIVLIIETKAGQKIVNLENVSIIEFDDSPSSKSLDFSITGDAGPPYRVMLRNDIDEQTVMNRLHMALSGVYEPRGMQTHGVKLLLNMKDLQ